MTMSSTSSAAALGKSGVSLSRDISAESKSSAGMKTKLGCAAGIG